MLLIFNVSFIKKKLGPDRRDMVLFFKVWYNLDGLKFPRTTKSSPNNNLERI